MSIKSTQGLVRYFLKLLQRILRLVLLGLILVEKLIDLLS